MPVLLVSPVEGVDPSGEVAAHVHVQQQLLPLLPVVLQPQQQLINPTHILILLHGDSADQGFQPIGQLHGVFIEGKDDKINKEHGDGVGRFDELGISHFEESAFKFMNEFGSIVFMSIEVEELQATSILFFHKEQLTD